MFEQVINDFTEVLSHWMKQVDDERENYNGTSHPEQFIRSFIFLLDQVQFFDSLWSELHIIAKKNLVNLLKYNQHLNLPRPQYYILKNDSSDKEILKIDLNTLLENSSLVEDFDIAKMVKQDKKNDSNIKDNQIVPAFFPNVSKAYALFIQTCQDLENAPNRYFDIGRSYLKLIISELIKISNKIEESVIKSPPAKLEELSFMIQQYNEIWTVLEKYQKNSFKEIFNYFHYQTILHLHTNILTHGQIKLRLITIKFSDLSLNKTWNDDDEIQRMLQQVENKTKSLTTILLNYTKAINVSIG